MQRMWKLESEISFRKVTSGTTHRICLYTGVLFHERAYREHIMLVHLFPLTFLNLKFKSFVRASKAAVTVSLSKNIGISLVLLYIVTNKQSKDPFQSKIIASIALSNLQRSLLENFFSFCLFSKSAYVFKI